MLNSLTSIMRPVALRVDVKAMVQRAFAAADLNTECAAALLGIPATQLSRQLAGREHLSLQRLLQIDDPRFWASILGELGQHFGVRSALDELRDDVRAVKLALVTLAAKRMVRVNSGAANGQMQKESA